MFSALLRLNAIVPPETSQCTAWFESFHSFNTSAFYISLFIWTLWLFATLKTRFIIFLEFSLVPPQAEKWMSSLCLFQSVIIIWSYYKRNTPSVRCDAGGRNANWVIWFGLNEEEHIVRNQREYFEFWTDLLPLIRRSPEEMLGSSETLQKLP